MTNKILIKPTINSEDGAIDGFDLLLDFWIDTVLKYDDHIDPNIVEKALQQCINQWPLFARRKITETEGQVTITDPSGLLFEVVNSSDTYEANTNMLATQANPYLTDRSYRFEHKTTLSSPHIPLLQIRLTDCPNGSVLGVSIWHPISDTVALFSFLEDVITTYKYLSGHTPKAIAAETANTAATPVNKKAVAKQAPVIPTQEQIDKELVPRPTQLSKGFDQAFKYNEYGILDTHINTLSEAAQAIDCHWSDLLTAKAWQCLPKSMTEIDQEQTLHIINSTSNILQGQKTGNNLVTPSLCLQNDDWLTIAEQDLAKKIRHTVNFKTLITIRESLKTRKWLSAYLNGLNHNSYIMKLFSDAIFGTGIIFNNFSFLETVDLSFNGSRPNTAEFSVDPGPKVFSLLPFGDNEANWTFHVALFENDLAAFNEKFTKMLAEL